MHCQRPIVCPPNVRVRDFYAPQVRQYIHPQVTVNRLHRVLVNQHSFPQITRNVTDFSQYNVVAPPQQRLYY